MPKKVIRRGGLENDGYYWYYWRCEFCETEERYLNRLAMMKGSVAHKDWHSFNTEEE
jgi:hypothetical protein